jgi:hypothetical protein
MEDEAMTANDEYPQVILGPNAGPELTWQNHVVLDAVQASLGNIGPDVRGIAVQAEKDRVTFHFALTRRTEQADEDIADTLAEFEALTMGTVRGEFSIDTTVTVGDTGPQWSGYPGRRIFLAHE